MIKNISASFFFSLSCFIAYAQIDYSNNSQQLARLNLLVKEHSQKAKLKSIGKSAGGKDLWMMTIGTGNTESKPAIAIVGGIEGNHLLGTELSIGFAEKILRSNTDSIKTLLSATTFYVFPNMSPDAMEQYFANLKYERHGNARQTDDDRDGKINEDGFDDLDNNGKITMMRIESPIGEYRINTEEPRGMVKADLTKGETGSYILLTEGIDNDKDGEFNEDGEGGVWINKNLTYKHPSFTQGSGEFPVSEPETRSLLDLLYTMYNVYAVLSFSSNNNLSTPYTYNAANVSQRIVTGYQEQDAKVNAMVSDLYNKTLDMKDAPKNTAGGGDFLSWAYYHYGRFSFSTSGWYIPKPKTDTTKKDKPPVISDSVATYVRWATKQNMNINFTDWKMIQHPDFPDQKVEVGGIDPFVLINPPFSMVEELKNKHTDFIIRLALMQPRIDITKIRKEKLGNNITRITVTVINTGALPSHSRLGEKTYWVKRINVRLNMNNNQSVLSGKRIQVLNSMEGYSSKELTWLVRGTGKIEVEAGSPTTGTKKIEIIL